MKIYTKRGDSGETDLFGGERVLKNHPRVMAYGDIDAANCAIGMAVSTAGIPNEMKQALVAIMKLLFCAGAEVACAPKDKAHDLLDRHLRNHIGERHIEFLESGIDAMEKNLVPLKNFILPTGSELSSRLHFARTVVRHAESTLVALSNISPVRLDLIKFINRLSDYLFVMARAANHAMNVDDITWHGTLEE